MSAPEERLLSPQEVADWLGVPRGTIYQWRTRGDGPRGYRVGKHVRYRLSDVQSWLEEHADSARASA